jgi:hypothetical protein
VNKAAEAMLASILEELAASAENQRQCEAKAIFRLLNYCPRGEDVAPLAAEAGKDEAR